MITLLKDSKVANNILDLGRSHHHLFWLLTMRVFVLFAEEMGKDQTAIWL